jgi:hypothetical protein
MIVGPAAGSFRVVFALGCVAVMVAAVAFHRLFWRAPAAEEVCANVARVLDASVYDECLRSAWPPPRGRLRWVRVMKCRRDANSRGELRACEAL